jgi:predicted dehydrogenase
MKTLFLGTGSIGRRHIRNLHKACEEIMEPIEIDAFRSSKKGLPEGLSGYIRKEFRKWSDLSDQYDVVFVCNPTALHAETLDKILDLNSDVFIEKPIYHHPNCHIKLRNRFSAQHIYHVACSLRFHSVIKALQSFVKERSDIYSIRIICSSWLPDWRPNVDYRSVYSAQKALGGGVALDLIHEVDYAHYIFGKPKRFFRFAKKASNLEIDVDDIDVYVLDYGNFFVELHIDYFGRRAMRECQILCSDSRKDFDIANNTIIDWFPAHKVTSLPYTDTHLEEMRYFLRCVKERHQSFNTPDFATETLRISLSEAL